MQNFRALGAPPSDPVPPAAGGFSPKPPASGSWGLRPQTPIGLRRLGAPPPDPSNSPPIANFWLRGLLLKVIVRIIPGIMLFIRTDNSRKCIFAAFPLIKNPYCILESMRL